MKKIIVSLLVIVNLLAITANAAWEFEEEIINEKATQLVEYNGKIISHHVRGVPAQPVDGMYYYITNGMEYKYENGILNTGGTGYSTPAPTMSPTIPPISIVGALPTPTPIPYPDLSEDIHIEQCIGEEYLAYKYIDRVKYYGVVSKTGEIIVPFEKKISSIKKFVGDYAICYSEYMDSVIDKNLNIVMKIPFQYDEVELAIGADKKAYIITESHPSYGINGRYLVDLEGNVVLADDYERIFPLDDGGVLAEKIEKKDNGKSVRVLYSFNEDFSERIAHEINGYISHVFGNGTIVVKKSDKFAFIDKNFEQVTDFIYDYVDDKLLTVTDGETETKCYCISKYAPTIEKEGYTMRIGENERILLDMNFEQYDFKDRVVYSTEYGGCKNLEGVAIFEMGFYPYKYALADTMNMKYIYPYSDKMITLSFDGRIYVQTDFGTQILNSDGSESFKTNRACTHVFNKQFGIRKAIKKIEHTSRIEEFAVDAEGNDIFKEKYSGGVIPIDYGKFLVCDGEKVKLLTRNNKALHTDIKTLINGTEIPCYSAEGRCVVVAEDLRNYGFDVIWNGEERRLDVTRNSDYYNINPLPVQEKGISGSYYDKITTSDISVYFNGREINGYCINGVTLIQPESLKSDEITFNYDDSVRTLYMNVEGLEQK